eukprot:scaffold1277_cov253-Pinguiococcus_pyrenoidosus.AAC.33
MVGVPVSDGSQDGLRRRRACRRLQHFTGRLDKLNGGFRELSKVAKLLQDGSHHVEANRGSLEKLLEPFRQRETPLGGGDDEVPIQQHLVRRLDAVDDPVELQGFAHLLGSKQPHASRAFMSGLWRLSATSKVQEERQRRRIARGCLRFAPKARGGVRG